MAAVARKIPAPNATDVDKRSDLRFVAQLEEDMLPRLSYSGISSIGVDAVSGVADPIVRLSDGKLAQFTGPQTFSPSVAGLGGLDTGALDPASTWMHLYLVVAASVLRIVGSLNLPFVGPTGFGAYRHIGAVRNDGASDLIRFNQISAHEFRWTVAQFPFVSGPAGYAPDPSPVLLNLDTFIPRTSSAMIVQGHAQAAGASFGSMDLWVTGQQAGGTATAHARVFTLTAFEGTAPEITLPTPGSPKEMYYQQILLGGATYNSATIASHGWIDETL